jgi:hypothetical protein
MKLQNGKSFFLSIESLTLHGDEHNRRRKRTAVASVPTAKICLGHACSKGVAVTDSKYRTFSTTL